LNGQILTPIAVKRQHGLVRIYRRFFEDALLCHNLKETVVAGKPQLLGDPMEVVLVGMAKTCLGENISYPKINEVPFDTDLKRLSTVHQTPSGPVIYCKGALEMLLPLCNRVQTGEAIDAIDAGGPAVFHARTGKHGARRLACAGVRLAGIGRGT
jgi:magnesium-transporting ATPase (P-type)